MSDHEPWLTVEPEESPEGTTVIVRGTFQDNSEPPVLLLQADLIALEATILDGRTREIVGDWNGKDVLGVNGGSWSIPVGGTEATRFSLRIPPADMDMLTDKAFEQRRICLAWTFDNGSGEDAGYAEVKFPLRKRPVPA